MKDSDLNELKGLLYIILGWCNMSVDNLSIIQVLGVSCTVIGTIHMVFGFYKALKGE